MDRIITSPEVYPHSLPTGAQGKEEESSLTVSNIAIPIISDYQSPPVSTEEPVIWEAIPKSAETQSDELLEKVDKIAAEKLRGVSQTTWGEAIAHTVTGNPPERKQQIHQALLDHIVNCLHKEYEIPPTSDNLEDLTASREVPRTRLLVKILGELDLATSSFPSLQGILNLLFERSKEPKLQDPAYRRYLLMTLLDEIYSDPIYKDSSASVDRLLHTIVKATFDTPLLDSAEAIVQEALTDYGAKPELGLHPIDPSQSLEEVVSRDLKSLANAAPQLKLGKTHSNLVKFQSMIASLGFTPLYTINFPNAMYEEVWVNRDSGERISIPLHRMATPTIDSFLHLGVKTNPAAIVGALKLEIDRLEKSGQRQLYIGHQSTYEAAGMLHGLEGKRTATLIEHAEKHPSTLFFYNLPLDGAFFQRTHKNEMAIDDFTQEIFELFCDPDTKKQLQAGVYFPLTAIAEELQRQGKSGEIGKWLDSIITAIKETYFSDLPLKTPPAKTSWFSSGKSEIPAEPRPFIDPMQQQLFLILFYARLGCESSLQLDAKRCHTCKDSIDRGLLVMATNYLMNATALGKGRDPETVKTLRTMIDFFSFIVKGRPMVAARSKLLFGILRLIEKSAPLSNTPAKVGNHQLEAILMPKPMHPLDRRTCHNQATTLPSYFAAFDIETAANRTVTFDDWQTEYFLSNQNALESKSTIAFEEGFTKAISAEPIRDLLRGHYTLAGNVFDGRQYKQNKELATAAFYRKLTRLTKEELSGDTPIADRLFQIAYQAATASLSAAITSNYSNIELEIIMGGSGPEILEADGSHKVFPRYDLSKNDKGDYIIKIEQTLSLLDLKNPSQPFRHSIGTLEINATSGKATASWLPWHEPINDIDGLN